MGRRAGRAPEFGYNSPAIKKPAQNAPQINAFWAGYKNLFRWGGTSMKGSNPLGRPGGDLLSHALRRSTISAGDFNDRVRDGIGWKLPAITTGPAKRNWMREFFRSFER
jgi:hypothetical protein